MLEIRLLGKFAVTTDGRPVELPLRAAQSLLACLALSPGAPRRREQLAGMLWPEADEATARGNLRHTLWRLRKALGRPGVVVADDLTLMFDPAAEYWLDAQLVGQKLPGPASAEGLIVAVSAYGGELLPGFYDDWVILERERLQAAFEQKMQALLERLLSAQRWEEALEWAERWIALGHTPEAAYRALITAHGHRGDSAAAAATYRRCFEALQTDLGIEPSAQTRAAYARWAQSGSLPPAAGAWPAPGDELQTKHNLPLQLSSFIGREKEIEQVKQRLAHYRLVTLRGSGGIGKTRLSIRVASELLRDYPDGVWMVEMAPVAEASLVPHAVAAALDVREEPGRPLSTTLADYLLDRTALLVWDNCEHVIDACARLAELLLRRCPDVRILTSSRETLGVQGETVVRVPSLLLPPEEAARLEAVESSEAVRLFVARAAEALPGFALTGANAGAVARVCRRLDGVALAIELAAARVAQLPVEQIAVRLGDAFRLLTGGSRTALPRQQTLRATLDWSYHLLSETECSCLRRLAVFAGSCTLEAAEAVCAGESVPSEAVLDLLAQLDNKSLVVLEREPGQDARYSLLETTRQYAREKLLEAGEDERTRRRHLAYYLKLAQAAELKLYDARQLEGLAQLDLEQSNLRVALGWALEGRLETGLELAGALFWYWHLRSSWVEGYAWLQRALAAGPGAAKALRARLLAQAGYLASIGADVKQATTQSEESIALYCEVGDKAGPAFPLVTLGVVASYHDYARGEALLEEGLALYREAGDKWGSRHALGNLGVAAKRHGQFDRAGVCMQASLALARELGVPDGIAWALQACGNLASLQGDYERALPLYIASLPIYQAVKGKGLLFIAIAYLVNAALHLGKLEQAKAFAQEALPLVRDIGLSTAWRIARGFTPPPSFTTFTIEYLALAEKSGDQATIALGLFLMAAQLWGAGQLGKAVRLYAAAWAAFSPIRPHSIPLERGEFNHDLTGTLQQLDEADFQRAWAEGSAMTLAEAVAYGQHTN